MSPRNDMDHLVAALAARQHGPVAHRQLRALGMTQEQLAYRLRIGRLIRHFPEVYLVGHPVLPREGRWMGAVLACGEHAALSHWDAAAHWGLMSSRGSQIHVTRPSAVGRAPDRRRIKLHRVGTLRPWECTFNEGIPTTTVARTLLDLSPDLRPRAMEDAIAHANRLGLFDLLAVRRCLDEHPRQHGAPALQRLLDALAGTDAADLRSMLEVLLLQLCDDHQLSKPVTNAQVEGFTVDFYWPHKRLIIEADSYTYHSMPSAFERDRERDQQLTLAGYTVVRFTYKQVTRQPKAVADRVRRLLG